MRKVAALVLSIALVVALVAPAAEAGGRTATNVALGLASFAVFNQVVGGFHYRAYAYPRYVYAAPAYYYPAYYPYAYPYYYDRVVYVQSPPAVEYQSPPQYQAQAQPQQQHPTVVEYPHGRYELRGDGIRTAYQWVWIPKPPPPPAAAPQQPSPTTP
jgi:hypothetical protein